MTCGYVDPYTFLSSVPRGALCNLYCSGLLYCVTVVLVTEAVLLLFLFFEEEEGGVYTTTTKDTFCLFLFVLVQTEQ